ncbi:MAG: Sec-independent protein translocase protein TatB [Sphingomonadaceae bacterium]
MFDIGFSELLVIGVVALIVIGPERLPRVARTVGHLAGRLQRYVADVKADINREMELDELRKMRDEMQQAATEMETSVRKELSETEQALNQAVSDVAAPAQQAVAEVAAPAPEPEPKKELPEKSATPEARG